MPGTENAFTPPYGELSVNAGVSSARAFGERTCFSPDPGDKETFLTLMSTGGTNGTFVCVTAVLLPDQAQ